MLKVAVDTITSFLIEHDMLVYIVVFDKSAFQISEKLFSDIASYIDDNMSIHILFLIVLAGMSMVRAQC